MLFRSVREDVRQRTNVVLVPVRDKYRLDRALSLSEVGDVWDDDVHAERRLVWEGETAVDQDDRVGVFVEVEVLANFAHATKGDQSQRCTACGGTVRSSTHFTLPCPLQHMHPLEALRIA